MNYLSRLILASTTVFLGLAEAAHAGIPIATAYVPHILASAIPAIVLAAMVNKMKPSHLEMHQIRFSNSPAHLVLMRYGIILFGAAMMGFFFYANYKTW